MNSYLVIGMGNFGQSVATELAKKNEVMVLDYDEKNLGPVMDIVTDATIGDAKDEFVLKALSVKDYDGVIVAVSRIEDSILINMLLKEMKAKSIIGKAKGELHAKILRQLGVDVVIRPEFDMGKYVAHKINTAHTCMTDITLSFNELDKKAEPQD